MTDSTSNAPAGWYPDANAPGGQRWWDGTRWTEHVGAPAATVAPAVAQPYQAFAPAKAPEGTKPGTVWIWLIVLLPLVGLLSFFLVDWKQFIDSSLSTTNPYGSLAVYSDPGCLISTAAGWISWALTVVFAALDVRALKKRGVPQPFHWAFAFIPWSIVYVIGRSVVVKRRTGSGMAPLWVYIAVVAVMLLASIGLVALIVNYTFQSIPFS